MGAGTVSCIIPAYNEASRISGVLRAVVGHPLVHETIVIDDGSEDNTHDVVTGFPVTLLAEEHNRGKTAALVRGIKASTGEILLFLDADLIGITAADVTALLTPVLSGEADVSMSLRNNTPLWSFLLGFDFLAGERVVPRATLTPHLAVMQTLPPFGFEVFMNNIVIANHLRLRVVPWGKVSSPYKYRKFGLWKGFRSDFSMARQIFQIISPFNLLRQIKALSGLRVSIKSGAHVGREPVSSLFVNRHELASDSIGRIMKTRYSSNLTESNAERIVVKKHQ